MPKQTVEFKLQKEISERKGRVADPGESWGRNGQWARNPNSDKEWSQLKLKGKLGHEGA